MEGSDPTTPAETAAAIKSAVRKVKRRDFIDLLIAAVAAFVLATAVNIPVSAWISHGNAHTNCVLIGELAGLGKQRVTKEKKEHVKAVGRVKAQKARVKRFEHESADRLGLSPAAFHRLIDEGQREGQEAADEAAAAHVEQEHRQAVLNHVANHACR